MLPSLPPPRGQWLTLRSRYRGRFRGLKSSGQTCFAILASQVNGLVADPFVPFVGAPLLPPSQAKLNGLIDIRRPCPQRRPCLRISGPRSQRNSWPIPFRLADLPVVGMLCISRLSRISLSNVRVNLAWFSCAHPTLSSREGSSISPTSSSSPLPQEPPSPEHGKQSPPKPTCRQGTPSFNNTQRKWSCSVCRDIFYDKNECRRHIGSVGRQAVCLACGKTIGLRKDNRRRHFTKYCKRMDLGRDGGLSFEDAFIEVHV